MNRIRYIRIVVFGETQNGFARIAQTTQPTISRWEAGNGGPSLSQLMLIRAEALKRKLQWSDALVFEAAA